MSQQSLDGAEFADGLDLGADPAAGLLFGEVDSLPPTLRRRFARENARVAAQQQQNQDGRGAAVALGITALGDD